MDRRDNLRAGAPSTRTIHPTSGIGNTLWKVYGDGMEIRDADLINGFVIDAIRQSMHEPTELEGRITASDTLTPGDLFSFEGSVFQITRIFGRSNQSQWEWYALETNIKELFPSLTPPDPVEVEVAVERLVNLLKETYGEDPRPD